MLTGTCICVLVCVCLLIKQAGISGRTILALWYTSSDMGTHWLALAPFLLPVLSQSFRGLPVVERAEFKVQGLVSPRPFSLAYKL